MKPFRRAQLMIILFMFGVVPSPVTSFAGDNSKGFYAGPLSDTPENVQKKADVKKMEKSQPAEETVITDASNIVKTESFSFKSWISKVLGYRK